MTGESPMTEQKSAVEPVVKPAPERSLAHEAATVVAQAAAQPGAQVTFNAVVSQAINPAAWTAENLGELIRGITRYNETQYEQWRTWAAHGQQRYWAELVAIGALMGAGIWLKVAGQDWGLTLTTAAASFYFGYVAGRAKAPS